VKLLEKQAPALLNFTDEVKHCNDAARISLPTIQADMASLQRDFTTISTALETQFKEKDKFTDIMGKFLEKAKGDLEQMNMNFKIMEDKYKEAVTFFGDDPKTMQPEEFFGVILRFAQSIQEAKKQNEQAAVNEEKMKRREDAKHKREAEMDAKKKAAAKGGVAPDGHDNVVDELFGALKGGNLFKNRRNQLAQAKQAQPPQPKQPSQPLFPALKKTTTPPTNPPPKAASPPVAPLKQSTSATRNQ
jgi:hypothetical protein